MSACVQLYESSHLHAGAATCIHAPLLQLLLLLLVVVLSLSWRIRLW
jgi:hypothetical protein